MIAETDIRVINAPKLRDDYSNRPIRHCRPVLSVAEINDFAYLQMLHRKLMSMEKRIAADVKQIHENPLQGDDRTGG